ncbi:MAG: T9SS type A sorting domain-containing protein [Candidatus Kapabacteria bacterium]|nr:T9SS type A sorting domain-containing protein [Candidatus Kapabacteria bacterium]
MKTMYPPSTRAFGLLTAAFCILYLTNSTVMEAQTGKELFPEQLLTSCCEQIDIDYYVTEDCCIQIDIDNPSCEDAKISILYRDPYHHLWQIKHVESAPATTVSYKLCPTVVSTTVQFKVIIQYANGAPHCDESFLVEGVNQFTFNVDRSQCCNCEGSNTWLTASMHADTLCPDSCTIRMDLDIPDSLTCLKYFIPQNQEAPYNEPLEINTENIENFYRCLGPGESTSIQLFLLASPEEYLLSPLAGCKVYSSFSCDTVPIIEFPEIDPPCSEECPDSAWTTYTDVFSMGSPCSACLIYVEYVARRCNGKQELQIVRFFTPHLPNCIGCPDDVIYSEAIKYIINKNAMNFEPREEEDCDTTWRVGVGSCWATWEYYQYIMKWQDNGPSGPGWVSVLDTIVVREVCDSVQCCFDIVTVCRLSEDAIDISIDSVSNRFVNCDFQSKLTYSGLFVFCTPACNWLDSLEGEYQYILGKENIFEDTNPSSEFIINSYTLNENIVFEIQSQKSTDVDIRIYDLLGNLIIAKTTRTSTRLSEHKIDLTQFQSGTYIYSVVIGSKLIKSDKFIYLK